MSDAVQTVVLELNLGDDAHPDEVNDATTQLYRELLNSDADHVEKVRSDALAAGAKGDPITIGAIALGVTVAVAPEVVKIINNWIARRHLDSGSSLTVKLGDNEISFPVSAASTPDELEALTNRLVAKLKEQGTEE
ncbi:MAG: hypothetical protein KDJ65_16345 [Anaerolineae bacterium]|nr:hypothetical protein [Anaerolineae bacterium]